MTKSRDEIRQELYKLLGGYYRRSPDELADKTLAQQFAMLEALPEYGNDLVFNSMDDFQRWKRSKNG